MTNGESSSRNQVIYAEVVARAWQDASFKQQLLANPKQVLTEAGLSLPESTPIQVLENSATTKHLVIDTQENFESIKDALVNAIASSLSDNPQAEVVIHQKNEAIIYFILPKPPQGATKLGETDLAEIAGGQGESAAVSNSQSLAIVSLVIDGGVAVTSIQGTSVLTQIVTVVL